MDIEASLIMYLDSQLNCSVFADVPAKRPNTFITVERVGGGATTKVSEVANLAIQCWAQSRANASATARSVFTALLDAVAIEADMPNIGQINVDSLYNFPDLESGQARYQMVVEVVATLQ